MKTCKQCGRSFDYQGIEGTGYAEDLCGPYCDGVWTATEQLQAKIAQLLTWVPHPSEMSGWDDPDCDQDLAATIREACELHGVDVPEHLIETR